MKKIFIIITVILLAAGCDTSLDIENPNALTSESYWNNEEDAIAGVNSIYSTLHRGSISRWMFFYYIIRSDEGMSVSPATDIVNNMDQFIVTNYNYSNAYGVWHDLYVGIYRANQVIAYVPDINMDESLRARIIAEAQFMRGLFYYYLVTLWGNVPIMDEPSSPTDKPSTSPVEDVWAFIETDLLEAADALPESYTDDADLGRATRGAAKTLLAKAYMQQGEYDNALDPLEWMVEGDGSDVYALMDDYRDNFLITTENNKESVFEWQFDENTTETTDDDTSTPNQNYGSSLPQFFGPSSIGWSDGEANRWVTRAFLDEKTTEGERDPRLEASYLYDSTDVRGPAYSMIYGETFESRYGTDNERVWFRKFQNDHWKNEEGYRSPNNYRCLRYADVLLMYAECLNAEGQTTKAYTYVDEVRARAGLAALSDVKPNMDQSAFLEQIKHERLLELSGEGHRWNDLARWGDLGPDLASRDEGFANFVVGKHELLPIPTQEIDINPNLSQNEGW